METAVDPGDPVLPQQGSFSCANKGESDYLGLGYSIPHAAWLDVRVFYVRVSCCSLEDAPESLNLRYVPRPIRSSLEVNGSWVSPAEEAILVLRRDRVDKESAEATYVSTDRLRTTGSLPFEVSDKEETLICGAVEKRDTWSEGQVLDRWGAVVSLAKGCKTGWVMECKSAILSPGCAFLKRRGAQVNINWYSPSMEVYVAGQFSGSPVILTQTVQLVARRKTCRRGTLDAIPETDESERPSSNLAVVSFASQMEDSTFYQEVDNKQTAVLGIYEPGGYMEGEDGEMTWFNAGVRVGVGIGLGMCVGIGIGVGLLMRAYQTTSRTFRRRFI